MLDALLWFDSNEQRELDAKVELAAQYYESKYQRRPTLCFVHPAMLIQGLTEVDGIELRGTHSILPNHFWIGIPETVTEEPE